MACHVGATGPARMAVRRPHSAPELQLSTLPLGDCIPDQLSARLIEAMFGNFFQQVFYVTGVNNDIF
jgi:hypothetical protein